MKKIGIITFHRANNYGAVLQAYALQKYVELTGNTAEIVDYRSSWMNKQYILPSFLTVLKRRKIRSILNYIPVKKREHAFEMFRMKYIKTGNCFSEDTIRSAEDEYDSFVFGSDQIWNYELSGNDEHYLGSFVKNTKKLNSYAASFGTYRSDDAEYCRLLARFNKVSLREESGLRLYEELTNRTDIKVVLDPVFLLEKDEWEKLASKEKKGKYIFLYTLQGKATKMMEVAQFISQKTGMPIVEMQAWVKPRPKNTNPRYCDDPIDFLSWIKNSEVVITDSFHCTAFSILFQKNFWVRIVECKEARKSRVGNLLYSLHLEDRVLMDNFKNWSYNTRPNYKQANSVLSKTINESKSFLKEILDEEIEK